MTTIPLPRYEAWPQHIVWPDRGPDRPQVNIPAQVRKTWLDDDGHRCTTTIVRYDRETEEEANEMATIHAIILAARFGATADITRIETL
jgi:hypothetical protein